jgi:transposase InsO family protein
MRQYVPSEEDNADQHFVKMRLQATSRQRSSLAEATDDLKIHQLATIVPQYGYYDKSEFLTEEPDEDYADERLEVCPPLLAENTSEPWQQVQIEGPESLRIKLVDLLKTPKYAKLFSETTSPIPSNLTPIRFEVDEEKWFHDPYNRQPTRAQSLARQYAIDKFLAKAIADGIIKPSSAPAWSQLFLTPKKNGDFRICLDYRNLNKLTKRIAWPIPRIDEMLHRIGSHCPLFFAVFDLTSGYFQCPIYTESQKFTTFATSRGNFMWTRLPMGQSNAPAHFQQEMTMTVFQNEMYKMLEIYLDDLLTWATSEDQLIERLTIIFDKLLKFNITLNPTKCKLGLEKVEYVGHTIDKTGVHFSNEKLDSVLNFPLPTNHEELRSFLGLCTYFSSHVERFSDLAHDLRMAMHPFKKSNKIHWTTQLRASYDKLRLAVGNCPVLSFPEPEGEIMVETDASDYAIGAAVFQNTIINGVQVKKPIAFLSKQLTDVEKRWSTIEKEAYAIFVALTKWEWLLRDISFTLHTDHKNLTFIEKDARGKVKRWKLAIQQFNFQIYWLKGETNILADKLSRSIAEPTSDDAPLPNSTARLMAMRLPTAPNEHHTYFHGDGLYKGQPTIIDSYKVIGKYHGTHVGHMGYDKTIDRLEAAGYSWASRATDVQMFIRRCPCCQKMKLLKAPIVTNPYTVATYHPMDRLNIDTIGPMPEDQEGYKYIVVVIDSFTRFIELYRAKDATGATAAQVVLQHVGRYGTPNEILTDNGPQFKNELIATLKQALQVTHNFTTPYSHEENAMVERANKEVNRHLRSIIYDKKIKHDWSLSLPLVQRILNSQVHSTTKVSPAQLLFGNSINLERRMFREEWVEENNNSNPTIRTYMDNLLTMQDNILRIARQNQSATDVHHIQDRKKGPSTEFPINSYVLFMDPSGLKPAGSTKLNTPRKGPYRVVNRKRSPHRQISEPEDIYVIENLISHELRDVSIHTLQPFEFDADHIDPTSVATVDNEEFFIEKIITHEPNIAPSKFMKLRKDEMRFLVKYQGYDVPEFNSWENLRRTEALHQYLHTNGMKSLVPPSYRITALMLILARNVQ